MVKKASNVSVVTGEDANVCRPFILEFRIAAPEAGFKISVMVEKGCTATAESTLKLVFDLFKKIDKEFVEIVHVSFKAVAPIEKKGIEKIASDGVPAKAAKVLRQKVFAVAKQLEGRAPTASEKAALKDGMREAAVTVIDL